jgi:hypothetical protein
MGVLRCWWFVAARLVLRSPSFSPADSAFCWLGFPVVRWVACSSGVFLQSLEGRGLGFGSGSFSFLSCAWGRVAGPSSFALGARLFGLRALSCCMELAWSFFSGLLDFRL